ncbi:MAG TPA: hypothetical protein VGY54_15950 [Polyangiaceae bacterium]|jgi:hypothetical protein|nr:hypothetical protein [Polyangiaceae bacterium]
MRRDPDALFATRKTKTVPFDFVLEELAALDPWTRPMFGCTAVYIEEKIVFVLRDKKDDDDNGVWIATTKEHHESLRHDLPKMRSITVLGVGETGWQVLPSTPTSSRRACSGRAASFWQETRGSGRCRRRKGGRRQTGRRRDEREHALAEAAKRTVNLVKCSSRREKRCSATMQARCATATG